MEENNTPGLSSDGISGDIFREPTSAAWDAAQLIFGDWLRLLFSEGGEGQATLMTHVAGYTNFLAYILITVIIAYVLIASIVKTASEGKVMGNNWSTVWLPLRVVLASFLIFPIGIGNASTISFIQASVAWLGMVGSNAADNTAAYVAKNLTKTSFSLSSSPAAYSSLSNMVNIGFCVAGQYNGMEDLILNGVEAKGLTASNPPLFGKRITSSGYGVGLGESGGVTTSSDQVVFSSSSGGFREFTDALASSGNRIYYGSNGRCGSIFVDIQSSELQDVFDLSPSEVNEIKNTLLEIVYNTQNNIYQNVVLPLIGRNMNATKLQTILQDPSVSDSEIPVAFRGAINSFYNELSNYENAMTDAIASSLQNMNNNEFIEFASQSVEDESGSSNNNIVVRINTDAFKELGWAYLGAYYGTLSSSMGDASSLTEVVSNVSNFSNPDGCADTNNNNRFTRFLASGVSTVKSWFGGDNEESCQYTEEFDKSNILLKAISTSVTNNPDVSPTNRLGSACSDADNCSSENIDSSASSGLVKPFLRTGVGTDTQSLSRNFITLLGWGGSQELGMGEDNYGNFGNYEMAALSISDPISFTTDLGHTIIYTTNIINGLLAGLSGVESMANNVFPGVAAGAGGILGYIIDYVATFINFLAVEGAVLAYLTPMLPGLIWAMAFLSWLLMYAEAVFNAPLAVTLMATPEGEGISGSRLERQIALIAGLVLKPFMLVVGMLLSMIMLNIGFVFLNQIFWITAGNSFANIDILSVTALISIWFMVVVIFMHGMFKIIPTFADDSLQWFLGNVARNFGNDIDNISTDKLTESSGRSGKGIAAVSSALSTSAGRTAASTRDNDSDDESSGKNN